ncbi:hypothetical protein EV644_11921 [Kribbella orskensis]|uniref:Uncharacterized protein n=1 Tax=Kribbella orskensis TaxID=2512216 RepID=A0ABY2BBB6_9ACTN|nr:hypothetical protein EV642_120121 [Kribbella sp. VKM Ac-2500]TCO14909.1 hypothetical protein EV644_11921 [Kribbella orskensis]
MAGRVPGPAPERWSGDVREHTSGRVATTVIDDHAVSRPQGHPGRHVTCRTRADRRANQTPTCADRRLPTNRAPQDPNRIHLHPVAVTRLVSRRRSSDHQRFDPGGLEGVQPLASLVDVRCRIQLGLAAYSAKGERCPEQRKRRWSGPTPATPQPPGTARWSRPVGIEPTTFSLRGGPTSSHLLSTSGFSNMAARSGCQIPHAYPPLRAMTDATQVAPRGHSSTSPRTLRPEHAERLAEVLQASAEAIEQQREGAASRRRRSARRPGCDLSVRHPTRAGHGHTQLVASRMRPSLRDPRTHQ